MFVGAERELLDASIDAADPFEVDADAAGAVRIRRDGDGDPVGMGYRDERNRAPAVGPCTAHHRPSELGWHQLDIGGMKRQGGPLTHIFPDQVFRGDASDRPFNPPTVRKLERMPTHALPT